MEQIPDSTLAKLKFNPELLTDDAIVNKLNFFDQLIGFGNSINFAYVIITSLMCYFVITQVNGIKTIKPWEEITAKIVIAAILGVIWIFVNDTPFMHIMYSFTFAMVFHKWVTEAVFHFLESKGKIKLPAAYVDAKVQSKMDEITHLEMAKKKEEPPTTPPE